MADDSEPTDIEEQLKDIANHLNGDVWYVDDESLEIVHVTAIYRNSRELKVDRYRQTGDELVSGDRESIDDLAAKCRDGEVYPVDPEVIDEPFTAIQEFIHEELEDIATECGLATEDTRYDHFTRYTDLAAALLLLEEKDGRD